MADQGRIQELGAGAYPGYSDHRQTTLNSLAVDSVAPRYFELARAGLIFCAQHTIATAITPVQTYPTTTGNVVLNNVNTNGGLLVPLKIAATVGSGTAAVGASLLVGVTPSALATQLTADGTGVVHKSLRDAGKTPTAYMDFGKTVVAPVYSTLGANLTAASTTPGGGAVHDCEGVYIVKPTFALVVDVLSGAGTSAKWNISIIYAMIPNVSNLP